VHGARSREGESNQILKKGTQKQVKKKKRATSNVGGTPPKLEETGKKLSGGAPPQTPRGRKIEKKSREMQRKSERREGKHFGWSNGE